MYICEEIILIQKSISYGTGFGGLDIGVRLTSPPLHSVNDRTLPQVDAGGENT